jgi:hypothetical protein
MLKSSLPSHVIDHLATMFDLCLAEFEDEFELGMPFGHGIFAGITDEADLHPLWMERIRHILRRPQLDPHPFTHVIEAAYPWRKAADFRLPVPEAADTSTGPVVAGEPPAAVSSEDEAQLTGADQGERPAAQTSAGTSASDSAESAEEVPDGNTEAD